MITDPVHINDRIKLMRAVEHQVQISQISEVVKDTLCELIQEEIDRLQKDLYPGHTKRGEVYL